MEIIGYGMALIVGLSLGLVGGGGSILAVPILAYLFGYDEQVATGYSLFIVGAASLVGGYRQHKNDNVDWKATVSYGIPAILGVLIVRNFVVPALPDAIVAIGDFVLTRRMAMFGLFSVLMFIAAGSLLFSKEREDGQNFSKKFYPIVFTEGFLIGAVTGFVGAGGGFLIIPALIFLGGIDIKKAIGTSLIIVTVKSLIGFLLGDALNMAIDWAFLLSFTSIVIVGIFIGTYACKFIDGNKLKKGFGYFIIVMAIWIFIKEFIIL
jgi:uncharacterized membrane protein YfcA